MPRRASFMFSSCRPCPPWPTDPQAGRLRRSRLPSFHLAQLNIGLAKEPIDSPLLAEFVAALDPINALADDAPGFVWRLQTDDGNATSIRAFEDERMILNMSVWESVRGRDAVRLPKRPRRGDATPA